jgi:hypothetical protein
MLTVDWYAFCGRCLRQVSAFEYAFELVSKFDTNRGDVFGEIAAGDKELRRAASYQHFSGEVLLGHGRVAVLAWADKLPQEKGYPE